MSMNRTLTQLQTNVGALFSKNLTDLVRGIRTHKDDESKYISDCVQEIKEELLSTDKDLKVQAIEKLTYLQMLGYPMDWASFRVIECIAHEKWTHKRVGYLAACLSFSETTDVMLLVTNLIRKDCLSPVLYEAGIALNCFSNICTTELARDLVPDIVSMLGSSRPYIRKKAVLVMYKIFLKFPDALRPSFNRLKERLDDQDPSVVSAAVNVICELARKNARNYLVLAPVLYKLLTKSANNWMLIKIVKLFSVLIPLEERLGKKLVEPLTAIINETNAMSLLYECIQTCIIGLSTYKVVMRLCVTKLRMFIEHPDQNLKYLGLVALSNIMKVFPRGIIEHRDLILNCLEDEDETIRRRSIELIAGMVDRKNLAFIVDKLKHYLDDATGLYKDELLEKIIDICSQEKYKNITDFEWYLGILLDLSAVKGVKNGNLLRDQILDVCVRVKAVREPAVGMLVDLFEDHALITEAPEVGGACEALFAAAWVVGEYCDHCPDPVRVINSLLNPDNQGLPAHIQGAYLMTITKILTMIGNSENPAAPEDFQTCIGLLDEHLGMFQGSLHIEVQERACFLSHLLAIFKNPEINRASVLAELKTVQAEILNPVSAKAGTRVKVPDGLDLDAWIGEPMPEDEEPEIETPSSRWSLEEEDEPAGPPQRYAGSGYGGGGNSNRGGGYNNFGDEGPKAYRPPDPEAVKKAAAERAAARAGNRYYLDAGGDDPRTPEEDLGPVRQLEEHVQLSQQEKLTFGQTIAKPQRGRRPGPRAQRVKQQVDIIEDDENPEGWVEEKNKPEEKVVKDALSMVVLDASAEKEALPERKHHVVASAQQKPSPTPTPVKKPEDEAPRRASQGPAARGGPAVRGGPQRGRGGGPARGRGGPARGRGGTGAGARGGASPAASPNKPPQPTSSPQAGSDKRKEEEKPAVVEPEPQVADIKSPIPETNGEGNL